jgi:drug/metabolite transporter (DMT)-like permease
MDQSFSISVIFGIGSALFWGASDFLGGLASRRDNAYSALLMAEWVGLICLLPLLFVFRETLPPAVDMLWAGLASVSGMVGLLLLYRALVEGQMSIAAPVSALLAGVIAMLVGMVSDGFPPSSQMVGFALALLAIWLISANPGMTIRLRWRALLLPLLAGIAFGGYFVLMHRGSQNGTLWPLISARLGGGVSLLAYMMITRKSLTIKRVAFPLAAACGLLDVIANACYVLAGQNGRLDVAAVLGSLYPGTTILLAALVLKERLARLQWVGIVAALAAIVLIAA